MSQWFTQLEDVAYSVVEYIPLVGTVYSLERAGIAYNERDWTRHWQSLGNFLESSVRDIILFKDIAEPTTVALIHTMAESLTDKLIEIYHHEPKRPEVKITQKLDKQRGHVLIAESSKGRSKEKSSEAKPRGEMVRLDIPDGLRDGAAVTFTWYWTTNYYGKKNVPEASYGRIKLISGTPTKFELYNLKGAGVAGYDFSGEVISKDKIKATTTVGGTKTPIDFTRLATT
ncbi:iso-A82775C biosynthesis cluster protein B-like [Raphanus sativus]|uniref:Iso-A82775C biosynthesis cluster protein B-like n=1 Tax=Raphanus sativus TaxID=3726 RepID=A0A9W3D9H7_RAPSA|nr:iso-A82775C biosynthesis cluster protein B-like [Raphanus sativus]